MRGKGTEAKGDGGGGTASFYPKVSVAFPNEDGCALESTLSLSASSAF